MVDPIDRAIHEAEELFVETGEAKANAEALNEKRRRTRAILFVEYRGRGKGSGESEQYAMADERYEAVCNECYQALLEAEVLKARSDAKRLKFEAWRTANATERAKMNIR